MRQHLIVFTIGHSTHSLDAFVSLLKKHGVTALVDVRSTPFSRYNPHFNKESLEQYLSVNEIQYLFLGRELGGRSEDKSCYRNRRVQYALLSHSDLFTSGVERVMRGAAEHCVALMCAEKDPLNCHRSLLVSRALNERGVEVVHILSDGGLESNRDSMIRLISLTGLPAEDLFRTQADLISEALARQEERIAYVDENVAAGNGNER